MLYSNRRIYSRLWEKAIKNQLQEVCTNRNCYFTYVGHLLKIKRSLDHRHTQWRVSTLDHHHCERDPRRKAQPSPSAGKGAKGRPWLLLLPKNHGNHSVTLDFQKNLFRGIPPTPWEFGTKRAREWNRANNCMVAVVPSSEMEFYFFNGSFLGCHSVGTFMDVNYGIKVDGDDHIYFLCHQHLIAKSK